MSEQKEHCQDVIWDAYQNDEIFSTCGCRSEGRHEFLASLIGTTKNTLNIGVGNGNFERLLENKRLTISSLDPSSRSIEKIRSFLRSGGQAKVGRAESIPWPDKEFDIVVMSEVLEHLTAATLMTSLSEVARVLKYSGSFIGTVPADENLSINMVVCPKCGDRFHRWGHEQTFSKESLFAYLNTNFQNIKVRRIVFDNSNNLNWKGRVMHAIRNIITFFGKSVSNQNLFFVARNPKEQVVRNDRLILEN
jgi:ubiquinone/menaquinone biosynthesis C-methylase UbiE